MKNEPAESANHPESEHQNVSTTIPPATLPENQPSATHAKSHAAHLDSGDAEPQTKPATRPGLHRGARKQPNGGHSQ
jgi:hypothetical protein